MKCVRVLALARSRSPSIWSTDALTLLCWTQCVRVCARAKTKVTKQKRKKVKLKKKVEVNEEQFEAKPTIFVWWHETHIHTHSVSQQNTLMHMNEQTNEWTKLTMPAYIIQRLSGRKIVKREKEREKWVTSRLDCICLNRHQRQHCCNSWFCMRLSNFVLCIYLL